jgi:surface antigen
MPKNRALIPAVLLGLALATPVAPPLLADPPPWAPAHGYRAKKGQTSPPPADYSVPVGIASGRCDTSAMDPALAGAVLGGALGGVIGSQIGGGSGKTVATIGGTLLGIMIGSQIGASMTPLDRGCAGQSLQYASDGQMIAWRNPDTAVDYQMIPQRSFEDRHGRQCREYRAKAVVDGRAEAVYGTACRQPDGSWQIVD